MLGRRDLEPVPAGPAQRVPRSAHPAAGERVIGSYASGLPGPLVVVVGGVHGNEPAGVFAAQRVLAELERRRPSLRGRLLCLRGNVEALAFNRRYLREDLNRIWTEERLARLRGRERGADDGEERELRELLEEIEGVIAQEEWTRVVLLDLHSTSADGAPFSVMADTIQNRDVAFALPIPVILGLEERIDGTLLSHFGELGHVAVCIEGGQNELGSTVDHHAAAIWLALLASQALTQDDLPNGRAQHELLAQTAWGLPQAVEIRYRFPIPDGVSFRMMPGFANFDLVRRGEHLAWAGPALAQRVESPGDGLLLMPRYQGQGDDGFFLGREVRRRWLALSAALRRLRLHWMLSLLPGVHRHPERAGALLANPKVARWLVVEFFHLFGYRWSHHREGELVFVRRPDRR